MISQSSFFLDSQWIVTSNERDGKYLPYLTLPYLGKTQLTYLTYLTVLASAFPLRDFPGADSRIFTFSGRKKEGRIDGQPDG